MLRPATREDVKDLIMSTRSELQDSVARLEGFVWNAAQMVYTVANTAATVNCTQPAHSREYINIPTSFPVPVPNPYNHCPPSQPFTSTKPLVPLSIPSIIPTSSSSQVIGLASSADEHPSSLKSSEPLTRTQMDVQARTDIQTPSSAKMVGPLPGVVIPNIVKGPDAWKKAIHQWEDGGIGLTVPLKDWPSEWYTGDMRKITGAKRAQRQIIYDEYIR